MEVADLKPKRFDLGQIAGTPDALEAIPLDEVISALRRHALGDWSEMEIGDQYANTLATHTDARVFSAYTSVKGVKFWIITEADRSRTTVILPSEY